VTPESAESRFGASLKPFSTASTLSGRRRSDGGSRLVSGLPVRQSPTDGRALQVGSDDQRTRIGLFEFGNGGIEIKQPDMTDDQSSDPSLLGYMPDYGRSGVKPVWCGTGGNREVHDQHVGVPGEINKPRVCTGLI
jgi:hypothetical protein